jgi:hypothetical protein
LVHFRPTTPTRKVTHRSTVSQLIKDAVEVGFAQSRDILEGIDDFADQQRASLAVPPNEVPEEPLAD